MVHMTDAAFSAVSSQHPVQPLAYNARTAMRMVGQCCLVKDVLFSDKGSCISFNASGQTAVMAQGEGINGEYVNDDQNRLS